MKIYVTKGGDGMYVHHAYKGFWNYKMGIASPSLTHMYSFNGLPEDAIYDKSRNVYIINHQGG